VDIFAKSQKVFFKTAEFHIPLFWGAKQGTQGMRHKISNKNRFDSQGTTCKLADKQLFCKSVNNK